MDKDSIRLTREEWRLVEEQCKDCLYWGNSKGCMLPSAGDPEPAPNCTEFILFERRIAKLIQGVRDITP